MIENVICIRLHPLKFLNQLAQKKKFISKLNLFYYHDFLLVDSFKAVCDYIFSHVHVYVKKTNKTKLLDCLKQRHVKIIKYKFIFIEKLL
jgi:hypothetical protein